MLAAYASMQFGRDEGKGLGQLGFRGAGSASSDQGLFPVNTIGPIF